jgi:ClpA/ClpB-like protein
MVDGMTKSPVPQLDELIDAIETAAKDPLQQVSAAVLVGHTLDDLADHLIGHFVDRARDGGASWTQIGRSLGVTKQAAQKRFVPTDPESAEVDLRIFARYTGPARAAMMGAQEQARRNASPAIRPGHLLLALLDDEGVRSSLDEPDDVGAAIVTAMGAGPGAPDGPVPFTPASKKAIELGHREALRRNDEHIEPKHLLLGVLAMTDEPEVSAAAGVGLDASRIA